MRIVLDTNVLLSGLTRADRPPGIILSAWHEGQFDLVISEPMIEEILRVFHYPKVRRVLAKAAVTYEDPREITEMLRLRAILVDVTGVVLQTVPQDPKDALVLATLIAAEAEWLVTGDKRDLLSLGLRNVITARDFLSRLEALRLPPLAEQPRAAYRVARERRKRPAAVAQA
ncbi:MAG: putative toxin-antitoxin system toxin component, PIN family [Burkholderiales bacterium]|nr:putative toxin-antitoxin system toxin component, PIN family [Burkholderiales bacterium]